MDFQDIHSTLAAVHKENPIVPLFLLKTFSILETSPVDVVTWSETGDSFIVLDPDRFASEVIPTHFKHNKFSSFVRQLNFYGFRKVKGKLNFVGKSEQHSWEFRHPYFQKGKPGLLADIRRTPQEETTELAAVSGPAETEQVEELKRTVVDLSEKVETLMKSVSDMQSIILQLTQGQDVFPAPILVPEDIATGSTDGETSPADWDIGDDELLMTFLEDLNDGPLPAPVSSPDMSKRSLKRSRSVDDMAAVLSERTGQVAKTSEGGDVHYSVLSNPAVLNAISNAVALTSQTSGASISFDQYSSALSAIISAAGSAQSQAISLATLSSGVASVKNQADVYSTFAVTRNLAVV